MLDEADKVVLLTKNKDNEPVETDFVPEAGEV